MMEYVSLNGKWKLSDEKQSFSITASVPGSVYQALMENGKMEDPFWRDNELEATKLMDENYVYERTFSVEEEFLMHGAVLLRCYGLDTVAEVWLNGKFLGKADNMHRLWEFDVKENLVVGENHIRIIFHSPNRYIKEAFAEIPVGGAREAMVGFSHLRKAHCMFGWDWGPRLPDAGIWRNIELLGWDGARFDSVRIRQIHGDGKVILKTETELEKLDQKEYKIETKVTDPNGIAILADGCVTEIRNPQLWWPRGYGEQPLYTVCVTLSDPLGNVVDLWEHRIGLRTLTVKNEKDQWGEYFAHVANGVEVFAMGANYIPEDNIFSRITPERTRKLLEDCVEANYNTIRVWGGGYYLDDYFYDICDELGLMVWQDFMFACACYVLTPEFEENIKVEIKQNVRRLRHHASLGLWCGNNELEWEYVAGTNHPNAKIKADYIKIYEYIIENIVKKEDPDSFYWPSSPSCGGSFVNPNDFNRGDTHCWDAWLTSKPYTDCRNHYLRYVSEFGYLSFPCMKTIESFTLPEDQNPFSRVMEMHQKNWNGNEMILQYLFQVYRYPQNLDMLTYASQLLQAEVIRYGVEHWRRFRGRCMGALYWQINDCWPVISCSSIDYYGRWKALHYFAKRFFAPVMISCCEEGELTQRPICISERVETEIEKSAHLCVANETREDVTGTVKWFLRDPDAKILAQGQEELTIPALTSKWIEKLEFPQADELANYISYEFWVDGEMISVGTTLFCAPKHFTFKDPELTWEIIGDQIKIRASAYAKCIMIEDAEADLKLCDNFFDLNGGEKVVKILEGQPKQLGVRSVYNIGR